MTSGVELAYSQLIGSFFWGGAGATEHSDFLPPA